jgi:hypothetical protein
LRGDLPPLCAVKTNAPLDPSWRARIGNGIDADPSLIADADTACDAPDMLLLIDRTMSMHHRSWWACALSACRRRGTAHTEQTFQDFAGEVCCGCVD